MAEKLIKLPVLALRDVVVYPEMVVPLFVGRPGSVLAVEDALEDADQLVLVTQRDPDTENPTARELYEVGTRANILQVVRMPNQTIKVLIEGVERVRISALKANAKNLLKANTLTLSATNSEIFTEDKLKAMAKNFSRYTKGQKNISAEIAAGLPGFDNPSLFLDTVAMHLPMALAAKQKVLESADLGLRSELVNEALDAHIELLSTEKKIRGEVKQAMEKSHRDYYLNEQIKAIQRELGELDEIDEIAQFAEQIVAAEMPDSIYTKAKSELSKLKAMSPSSAEATVIRNYLEVLVKVPWSKRSKLRSSISKAEALLDKEHYGLKKVKERIVEFLAVNKRTRNNKGSILCFLGPPGVGKTSLGQSIADATGREFARIALGGIRDEAEIRGHRRTYIGALPGRIIQSLSKVGAKNPLILLDEIDKLASDYRGDPASALLEVLDPEQNNSFSDHYLEAEFDLSEALFICTANTLNIPAALRDRMEIVQLSGYTELEKQHIATNHLIPKQLKRHGLQAKELEFPQQSVKQIIRSYTREAGVRNLERLIAKVCRKAVKDLVLKNPNYVKTVGDKRLQDYLGVAPHGDPRSDLKARVGYVTGLAWTEVGGEVLTLEALAVKGKGKISYTGSLGDVMKESIQAAVMLVRHRADDFGISNDFHEKMDLHIHVPDGAVPKDGPSAGVGMVTAMVSAISGIPVAGNVAMTGEITLRGDVLPIGGLKEKLLAANRNGISIVLIPKENEKDLVEIENEIKDGLEILAVKTIDEVLDIALTITLSGLGATKRSYRTKADAGYEGHEEPHHH